jgi:hypothetical protein
VPWPAGGHGLLAARRRRPRMWGGQQIIVQNEPVGPDPAHYTAAITVSCQLTPPGDAGVCPG